MPLYLPRWFHKPRKLTIVAVLLLVLIGINVVAYLHAHAMTHFAAGGTATQKPETMSLLRKARVLLMGVRIPRPSNAGTPDQMGLNHKTHRFAARDGHELEGWYIAHAQSRGLALLFHGYASGKSALLAEAAAFHEFGFAVFLIDFRGSGGSTGEVTTTGVHEADDVSHAVAYARETWQHKQLLLYGQSMGSAAILRAVALQQLQPDALILGCPFDRLLSTVSNRFGLMGLPAFPAARLLVFWGGVQHGFNGFAHNPVDYARAVRCPVLLLHGELDARVTQEQANAVFENLGGDKKMKIFAGVGHESYAKARPEEWRDAVAAFLSGIPK